MNQVWLRELVAQSSQTGLKQGAKPRARLLTWMAQRQQDSTNQIPGSKSNSESAVTMAPTVSLTAQALAPHGTRTDLLHPSRLNKRKSEKAKKGCLTRAELRTPFFPSNDTNNPAIEWHPLLAR